MNKANTQKATSANIQASIDFAIKTFEYLENLKDVLGENPSNKEIARTLNEFGYKTRLNNKWHTTSITRLMKLKVHYQKSKAETSDISNIFS